MKKLALLCVLTIAGTASASAQSFTFEISGGYFVQGSVSFRLVRRGVCYEDFVVTLNGSEDGQGKAEKIRQAVNSKISPCARWRAVSVSDEGTDFKFQYYSDYYGQWRDVVGLDSYRDTSGGALFMNVSQPGAIIDFLFDSSASPWSISLWGGSSLEFPVSGATIYISSSVTGSGLIDR